MSRGSSKSVHAPTPAPAPAGPSTSAPSTPAPQLLAPPPAFVAPVTPDEQRGQASEAGENGELPPVAHVQVSAVEYAFSLSRASVPAGRVVFQFVNDGQDEHNLKIAPPEGPLAGSFESAPAKGVADLTLDMQPGSYTLFCSLPTHEQKGMKATLLVE